MSAERTARLQVLVAALLFSTGGAAIKGTTLTGWQVAGFRSGVAALALLLLLPATRKTWSLKGALVGCAYAATLILFVLANKRTTAANTIFLQSTAPLYLVLLSPWLLKEPIRRRDLLFLGMLAIGMSLFFVGTEDPHVTAPDPALGNVLAAGSGVAFALLVTGLRVLGREESCRPGVSASSVTIGNLIACAFCLPVALPVRSSVPRDWILVAFLGVVQIALAYVFLTRGMRRVPAFEASMLLLVEPILNPFWAWLSLGETPTAWTLAGSALILGATSARTLSEARTVPVPRE